ncbi:MAG: hypothetical protein GQ565_06820 [Candidatus Aegiribacteria sp.]|nr:hypothetical protein [Candidatus Aegiribacteria sp.]
MNSITETYAANELWDEAWSDAHAFCVVEPVVSYHLMGFGRHQACALHGVDG